MSTAALTNEKSPLEPNLEAQTYTSLVICTFSSVCAFQYHLLVLFSGLNDCSFTVLCIKKKNSFSQELDNYMYLYVCFGFVEQAQGSVAAAVRSQGYEGLQPLQTQPQVSSSTKKRETKRGEKE